ncbi:MAG: hypothetical protein PHS41_02460 [Victivallaceae bacterium]|nr:hypothetical protein [Victivallaceae bacterium]
MKKISMFLVLLAFAGSVFADFTQNMVARWTFNSADPKEALTDDVGKLLLARTFCGRDTLFELHDDGTVTLGGAIALVADLAKYKELADGVTIWCRLKEQEKTKIVQFRMGLTAENKPADWKQMVFTDVSSEKGVAFRAVGDNGKEAGMASEYPQAPKDAFYSLAIVFNGKTKRCQIVLDGKSVMRHAPMSKLADFSHFMLGRLKASGGSRIVVDEIRIYKGALSPEWIDEIEPVGKGK